MFTTVSISKEGVNDVGLAIDVIDRICTLAPRTHGWIIVVGLWVQFDFNN